MPYFCYVLQDSQTSLFQGTMMIHYIHIIHIIHLFIYNRVSIILEIIVKCTLMCYRLAHLRRIDVECHVCLALAFYISLMIPFVNKYHLLNGAINEWFLYFVFVIVSCLIEYPLLYYSLLTNHRTDNYVALVILWEMFVSYDSIKTTLLINQFMICVTQYNCIII